MNKSMVAQALKVSGIVGTLLLLINQYEALFGGAEFRVIPAVLTYCVPFVVFIAGQLSGAQEDK
ncbi:MAG: nitrate/nitrite transporter NrtS [Pseudomonadales bacterium]|nr:nitrate/nitrite transporter NrtS [Pseudomonadales bacterium]